MQLDPFFPVLHFINREYVDLVSPKACLDENSHPLNKSFFFFFLNYLKLRDSKLSAPAELTETRTNVNLENSTLQN